MKLFVAQIYTVAQYDFRRLDEEKAFHTYEEAFEYLKQEFFEDECDESFLKSYFAEITEYNESDSEIVQTRTRFNCMGEVFKMLKNDDDDEEIGKPKEIDKNFVPQFKNGDVVTIKYVKGTSFSLFTDTIGVVTGAPSIYADWKNKYNLSDDFWEPVYMVEFVGDTGFLSHCHPFEQEMQLFENEIPAKLIVLEKLSNHFKKIKLIDEQIIKSMRFGEIYVLNNKTIKDVDWG